MEKIESSFKVLSASDVEKKKIEKDCFTIPLSKDKSQYIKHLMFSALEDPRKNYKPINTDDLEKYWRNPDGC
jgi:hypothetical protein